MSTPVLPLLQLCLPQRHKNVHLPNPTLGHSFSHLPGHNPSHNHPHSRLLLFLALDLPRQVLLLHRHQQRYRTKLRRAMKTRWRRIWHLWMDLDGNTISHKVLLLLRILREAVCLELMSDCSLDMLMLHIAISVVGSRGQALHRKRGDFMIPTV